MTSLRARLIGFLRFDPAAWRDLQSDPDALPQALAVVVVASVAAAVGAAGAGGLHAFRAAFFGELWQWAACAGLAWFFGITLFRQSKAASFMAAVPLFGFAQAPKAIGIFGLVPAVGPIAGFVGIGFFFVYVVAALRVVLGFDLARAAANAAAGFLVSYALFAGAFVSNGFDAAAFGSARPLAARLPKPRPATPHPAVAIGRNPADGAIAPQPAPKAVGRGQHPRRAKIARPTAPPATAVPTPTKAHRPKCAVASRGHGTPTAKRPRPNR